MSSMTPRQIVCAINAEAKRTDGKHPSGHVVMVDGVAYTVPRRQWGMTHSASGRPFGLPRAKEDTLHLHRVAKLTRCTCMMCQEQR